MLMTLFVSYSSEDVDELICELVSELISILKWLKTNCLGANPDIFFYNVLFWIEMQKS